VRNSTFVLSGSIRVR